MIFLSFVYQNINKLEKDKYKKLLNVILSIKENRIMN
jgi:hypothetical protein